jgi:hypothetical protein
MAAETGTIFAKGCIATQGGVANSLLLYFFLLHSSGKDSAFYLLLLWSALTSASMGIRFNVFDLNLVWENDSEVHLIFQCMPASMVRYCPVSLTLSKFCLFYFGLCRIAKLLVDMLCVRRSLLRSNKCKWPQPHRINALGGNA